MLPTRLNLLPPEKQKYLQRMVFIQFVQNTLESMLIVLCLVGISLLAGQWVLQGYFNDLTENTIAINDSQGENALKIKQINSALREAKTVQTGYVVWTPIMTEIGNTIPPGVTLNQISISINERVLNISGRADARKNLFELEQALESLPIISSIRIPHSLLNEQENISFSLSIELTP